MKAIEALLGRKPSSKEVQPRTLLYNGFFPVTPEEFGESNLPDSIFSEYSVDAETPSLRFTIQISSANSLRSRRDHFVPGGFPILIVRSELDDDIAPDNSSLTQIQRIMKNALTHTERLIQEPASWDVILEPGEAVGEISLPRPLSQREVSLLMQAILSQDDIKQVGSGVAHYTNITEGQIDGSNFPEISKEPIRQLVQSVLLRYSRFAKS